MPLLCDVSSFATSHCVAFCNGPHVWSHLKIHVPIWSWSNLGKPESSRGKSPSRTMWFEWKDPGSRLISTSVSPAVTLWSIDLRLASSLPLCFHVLFHSCFCSVFSSPAKFSSTPLSGTAFFLSRYSCILHHHRILLTLFHIHEDLITAWELLPILLVSSTLKWNSAQNKVSRPSRARVARSDKRSVSLFVYVHPTWACFLTCTLHQV